jgi:hypothetical protein
MAMLLSSPGHRSFIGSASPVLPEAPQTDADLFEIREHTFAKTFNERRFSHFQSSTRRLIVPVAVKLPRMHEANEEGNRTVFAL